MKAQEMKVQNYNAAKLDFLVDAKERKAISYKEYAGMYYPVFSIFSSLVIFF